MDLNFQEIDGKSIDFNNQNYWDNTANEAPKKKKFGYDDILNNMNLGVDQNGVLKFMTHKKEYPQQYPQQVPLESEVKNSYIFNKYFKDYKNGDAVPIVEPLRPRTIEELKQMLLKQKIERIQEIQRINQIKSTKLLFENAGQINASKNSLKKMTFR